MNYKQQYEESYAKKNGQFADYERNLLLPEFFPVTTQAEKVADVAGSFGIVTAWLEQRGYEATLIELTDVGIKGARERGLTRIVQTDLESAEPLPFTDNYFDRVFFGDIIEHLFSPKDVLNKVKRVLKPGGQLVISCPNIAYWRFRLYYLLDGDFQRIDVGRQKPWEQEHIRFYNVKILKEFLDQLGFDFIKFRGSNNIWHSKLLARWWPNLFAHTMVAEFIKR